jgi:hypothetical protein
MRKDSVDKYIAGEITRKEYLEARGGKTHKGTLMSRILLIVFTGIVTCLIMFNLLYIIGVI